MALGGAVYSRPPLTDGGVLKRSLRHSRGHLATPRARVRVLVRCQAISLIALLLNFSLNQREHAVIRAEIDRRNSPVEG